MKIISTFCLSMAFLVTSAPAVTAETVQVANVASYIGQSVTVEGMVAQVSTDGRSGNTFINFGGRYPDHLFYGIIFARDVDLFSGVHSLEGSVVRITGEVETYRGKPQIVIHDPSQLAVP